MSVGLNSIDDISAVAWDRLHDGRNPFLRHAFLGALERFGAASPAHGWRPHHLGLYRDGVLAGAVPLYLKTNSWGEFVFDWSWAHAAHAAGLRYYPKLLAGVPYTPVTGPRLLATGDAVRQALIQALMEEAESQDVSSIHLNFLTRQDSEALIEAGFIAREDVQFHWHNDGYRTFADFLDTLTHKRRKAVRRERRNVRDAGFTFRWVPGTQAGDPDWSAMHRFYARTFYCKGNDPVLSEACFRALGAALGDAVLMILGQREGETLAGAFFLRGPDTLYGRYWGSDYDLPGLHFETCYYQGLEYCIREGLRVFEPGAQGEHKMLRGFLPVTTRSCHWLKDPRLHRAVADAMRHERVAIGAYKRELEGHSPYREVS